MKLHLIYPPLSDDWAGGGFSLAPPLTLGVLAALTPDGVDITITDENLKLVDFSEHYDLVGISMMTSQSQRGYEIADRYRAQGTTVVLGGVHPSLLPEEASQHADVVCVGEAENYWAQVIEDFKTGSLKKHYCNEEWVEPLIVPIARRDLFAKRGYVVRNTIQVTRGCPYACRFCSVTRFFGQSFRYRPLDQIMEEMKLFTGQRVVFADDNLIGDKQKAKELFKAMIPLKIKWFSQIDITIANDDELLSLAAESGCVALYIGIESINQKNLQHVKKNFNRADKFAQQIEKIHSHGMGVQGAFIFGMDDDDESVFEHTLKFAMDNRLELAQFGILTPFPGTPLFDELQEQGRIINYDWSKYGIGDVVIRPRNMSAETLMKGTTWAWKEFYAPLAMIKRLGLRRKNAIDLWALNLAYRKYIPKDS